MGDEYFEEWEKQRRRRDLAKDEAKSFLHPHPKYWSQQRFKQKIGVHTRELETKGTIDPGEKSHRGNKETGGQKRNARGTKTKFARELKLNQERNTKFKNAD